MPGRDGVAESLDTDTKYCYSISLPPARGEIMRFQSASTKSESYVRLFLRLCPCWFLGRLRLQHVRYYFLEQQGNVLSAPQVRGSPLRFELAQKDTNQHSVVADATQAF